MVKNISRWDCGFDIKKVVYQGFVSYVVYQCGKWRRAFESLKAAETFVKIQICLEVIG